MKIKEGFLVRKVAEDFVAVPVKKIIFMEWFN